MPVPLEQSFLNNSKNKAYKYRWNIRCTKY